MAFEGASGSVRLDPKTPPQDGGGGAAAADAAAEVKEGPAGGAGAEGPLKYSGNDNGPVIWALLLVALTYFVMSRGAGSGGKHGGAAVDRQTNDPPADQHRHDAAKRTKAFAAVQQELEEAAKNKPAVVKERRRERAFETGRAEDLKVGWTMIVFDPATPELDGRRVEVLGIHDEADSVEVQTLAVDELFPDDDGAAGAAPAPPPPVITARVPRAALHKARGKLRVLFRVDTLEAQKARVAAAAAGNATAAEETDPSQEALPLQEMNLEDPFATVRDLRAKIAARLGLTTYQFHLLHGGQLIGASHEGKQASSFGNRYLRVFVIEKTLAEGYRPPPPADPERTKAAYANISRRLQAEVDRLDAAAAEDAGVAAAAVEAAQRSTDASDIPTGTARELSEYLRTHARVMVFFHLPGCPPCRRIKPFFELLSRNYAPAGKLKFFRMDGSRDTSRPSTSRYGVSSYPTFLTFLDGAEYQRTTGADENKVADLAHAVVQAEPAPRKGAPPAPRSNPEGGGGAVMS